MQNSKMEIKSLRSLIRELVSNFELSMFAPQEITDIDSCIELRNKFKRIFDSNTTFWLAQNKPASWMANWCFFELKSNIPMKVTACFCFEPDRIRVAVCDDLKVLSFVDEPTSLSKPVEHLFEQKYIRYKDIMLDHEKLIEELYPMFDRAIRHANRDKSTEPYPACEAVIDKEPA